MKFVFILLFKMIKFIFQQNALMNCYRFKLKLKSKFIEV